jgi:hypothetical protein
MVCNVQVVRVGGLARSGLLIERKLERMSVGFEKESPFLSGKGYDPDKLKLPSLNAHSEPQVSGDISSIGQSRGKLQGMIN